MEFVGGKCIFSSEWDRFAQDTYEANFGERPQGDITKIEVLDIPDHDILVAGFPCQSFSICGERKGFTDIRGTLFFNIENILKQKEPHAFLLENVRNLVSHDNGKTFGVICERLEALGYYVHWSILDGRNFGVPQKRERVIIVGFKANYPFKFPESGLRKPQTLNDILESDSNVDEKHFLSTMARKKFLAKVSHVSNELTIWHENKAGNIGINTFSCALRAGASYNYLTVNGKRRLTPREMLRLQGFPDSFKIVVADSHIRKQAGNSVVVPMMEAVATAMMEAMRVPICNCTNDIVEVPAQQLSFPLSQPTLCH